MRKRRNAKGGGNSTHIYRIAARTLARAISDNYIISVSIFLPPKSYTSTSSFRLHTSVRICWTQLLFTAPPSFAPFPSSFIAVMPTLRDGNGFEEEDSSHRYTTMATPRKGSSQKRGAKPQYPLPPELGAPDGFWWKQYEQGVSRNRWQRRWWGWGTYISPTSCQRWLTLA